MKTLLNILTSSPHRRYLLVFIILFTLYYVPSYLSYFASDFVKEKILTTLSKQGIDVKLNTFRYKFPANLISTNNIITFDGRLPPLQISSFKFNTKSLNPLKFSSLLEGYGGSKSCLTQFEGIFPNYPVNINCNINDIQLEKHPLLYSLGIEGKLSSVITGKIITEKDLDLNISLNLIDAFYDTKKSRLGSVFKFPELGRIDAQIDADLKDNKILIKSGNILSSLVNINNLSGQIKLPLTKESLDYKIEAILLLSEKGISELGSWLTLLDPGYSNVSRKIKVKIRQQKGMRPVIKLENT